MKNTQGILDVRVCPVCGSHEVIRLDRLVPVAVLNPEMIEGYCCLECDAVFPSIDDLNVPEILVVEA